MTSAEIVKLLCDVKGKSDTEIVINRAITMRREGSTHRDVYRMLADIYGAVLSAEHISTFTKSIFHLDSAIVSVNL